VVAKGKYEPRREKESKTKSAKETTAEDKGEGRPASQANTIERVDDFLTCWNQPNSQSGANEERVWRWEQEENQAGGVVLRIELSRRSTSVTGALRSTLSRDG